MPSNAGMANREGNVDLHLSQISAPQLTLWLGLAVCTRELRNCCSSAHRRSSPTSGYIKAYTGLSGKPSAEVRQ